MPHTERAPAKINLALHVLGRRDDGYHELDSIVAFADVGDELTFSEADDWRLDVAGPFAQGLDREADNLILKAARAFEQGFPGEGRPCHIALQKNLPIAAGIGGGSADAAATLRALAGLAGVAKSDKLAKIAASIGADVPVCLQGKTCRMRGVGERLDVLADVPRMPAVLVNPRAQLSTKEVFGKLHFVPGRRLLPGLDMGADLGAHRNELTMPALVLAPVIGKVLATLRAASQVRFARMSGSGATCFGIFETAGAAEAAAKQIAAAHEDWWVVKTTIG